MVNRADGSADTAESRLKPKNLSWSLLRMPNVPNLREKIAKSVLTVAVGYGCEIFCDFLAHLQRLGRSRYDSNWGFQDAR